MTTPSGIASHVLAELDRAGTFPNDEEAAQLVAVLIASEYPDASEERVRLAVEMINKGRREAAESRRLGLRPIEPVNTDGLDVGDPAHGEPICEHVNPRDLFVDPLYQRSIGERGLRQIRQIIEGWDWNRFKPPICAYAEHDGQTVLKVLDGQHTAIAACSHKSIARIPVMIVEAAETAEQADAFVGQNTGRLAVTPLQLHKSALVAMDGDAITVDRCCRRAGVKVLETTPKKYNPGETVAIAAIKALVDNRGAMKSRIILEVLAKAGMAPVTAHQIRAVEMLLCEEEYRNAIGVEDLTEAVAKDWLAAQGDARTLSVSHKLPFWKALGIVWFRRCRKRRITLGRAA
jgi:hypothetical protein